MKRSEILRNEAAVMLAGVFEQATHGLEFDFSGVADDITKKLLEAAYEQMQLNKAFYDAVLKVLARNKA